MVILLQFNQGSQLWHSLHMNNIPKQIKVIYFLMKIISQYFTT
jgi:hypothetical protein